MTSHFLQNNLFEDAKENLATKIPGLTYIPNFITPDDEERLIHMIDQQDWLTELKRRVQHYGWKYDYKAKNISKDLKLGDLPDWVDECGSLLQEKTSFPEKPDQVIINEYMPGQGIAPHIDCIPCFKEHIASLSLGSTCTMDFIHHETNEKISILLEPCSLILLSGDARYKWKHGIAARKTDANHGIKLSRSRRISMTFRNVILDDSPSP